MKKGLALVLCGSMLCTMAACSSNDEASDEPCVLTVSTFQLSEDIVQSDIIKPFEEKYNCKITTDLGNAADRYTKLESNPESGRFIRQGRCIQNREFESVDYTGKEYAG